MKEITILSGKGGAGKTSVTAALAALAKKTVFCDNDVDAADLHLILQPEIKEKHPFSSGSKATIDQEIDALRSLDVTGGYQTETGTAVAAGTLVVGPDHPHLPLGLITFPRAAQAAGPTAADPAAQRRNG